MNSYRMTEEEHAELLSVSEAPIAFWRKLAKKYGFNVYSVKSCERDNLGLLAWPEGMNPQCGCFSRADAIRALRHLTKDNPKAAQKFLTRALGLIEVIPTRDSGYTWKANPNE